MNLTILLQKKKLILVALIIIVGIVVIVKYSMRHEAYKPTTIWVKANKIKETSLPLEVRAIGTMTARSVYVTPEAAGHVEKILFKDGEFVKKGTPLIQLDDAVYQAKLASAKARLAYSEGKYKRMVSLGRRVIPQQTIDEALANLKGDKAALQESQVMLDKMRLTAPFDGMLGKSNVNPGDYVTVGQQVVMLTDVNHLRIEYNVSEKYLPHLKIGQVVTVTTSAYPDKMFTGKLTYIAPTINTDNRSVSLYAEFSNDKQELAAGMFVNVMQSLGSNNHALMVPARSLVPILDGEQVYKIVDGKAYATTVQVGKRLGNEVEIVGGVAAGDLIITDGQLKVKNAVPVKVAS